jgi:hypothetical protein
MVPRGSVARCSSLRFCTCVSTSHANSISQRIHQSTNTDQSVFLSASFADLGMCCTHAPGMPVCHGRQATKRVNNALGYCAVPEANTSLAAAHTFGGAFPVFDGCRACMLHPTPPPTRRHIHVAVQPTSGIPPSLRSFLFWSYVFVCVVQMCQHWGLKWGGAWVENESSGPGKVTKCLFCGRHATCACMYGLWMGFVAAGNHSSYCPLCRLPPCCWCVAAAAMVVPFRRGCGCRS